MQCNACCGFNATAVLEQALDASSGVSGRSWPNKALYNGSTEAWQGISANPDQLPFTVLLPPQEEVELLDTVIVSTSSLRTGIFADSVLLHVLDRHYTQADFQARAEAEGCGPAAPHMLLFAPEVPPTSEVHAYHHLGYHIVQHCSILRLPQDCNAL